MNLKITITSLFLLGSLTLFAQEKSEVERKVKASQVPQKAVSWMEKTFGKKNGISWYEELSSGKLSYEAKFKWNRRWHSVEFDRSGNIEDIEIRISNKELPDAFRLAFRSYLDSAYTKFKVMKIQEQWSGEPQALAEAVKNGDLSGITIRYEIEFYGKNNDRKDELWEGLFDRDGNLVRQRKIILRPSDNLLY